MGSPSDTSQASKTSGQTTSTRRRAQIVNVVLRLVNEHGVGGATTARIAAEVGVTEPTLYKYFDSRRDMLLAALDTVFDDAEDVVTSCQAEDSIRCLRNIGRYHSERTIARRLGFVNPLFEFIVAPPESGLRDRVRERGLRIVGALAAIVEEGQRRGRIRSEVDPTRIAWRIMAFYWFEDVSSLMGFPEVVAEGISLELFDDMIDAIVLEAD